MCQIARCISDSARYACRACVTDAGLLCSAGSDDKHLFSAFGKIGGTIVDITSKIMQKKGIKRQSDGFLHCGEITIYPEEYFCPKNYYTGELTITPNTCAIHHYTATWHKDTKTIFEKIKNRLFLMFVRYSVQITYAKNKCKN